MKVKTGRLSEAEGNSKKKVAIGSICFEGNAIFRDHTNHRSHLSSLPSMGFRRRIPPIALYRDKAEKLQESFYRALR